MPDALRRVSIHCGWVADDDPVTVDLSLPTAITVGELIPSIIDACGADDATPMPWRLCTIGGPALNESKTLAQNDVHDGDLLLLAPGAPAEPTTRTDSVTAALAASVPAVTEVPGLGFAGCVFSCALGILALAWTGLAAQGLARFGVAAVLAAAVITTTVGAQRVRAAPPLVATLNIVTVAQVAATGFLAVPAGPGAANVFLAAVAAGSVGIVLLRMSDCGPTSLLTVTAFAAVVAASAGLGVVWPALTLSALGAALAATGVGALALTPRLSIIVADLTPAVPGEPDDDDADDLTMRAARGHRTLAGLVTGCAVAASVGALLVVAGCRHVVTAPAVAFTAAVGVALVLRSRSYASGSCRTALSITGCLGLAATFALLVMWLPQHGDWLGLLAVAVGLALLWPTSAARPAAMRMADCLEYIALAAIVPLACWLAGIFDALGQL